MQSEVLTTEVPDDEQILIEQAERERNLRAMERELKMIENLSDSVVCCMYNTDTREEAIECIKDYWR